MSYVTRLIANHERHVVVLRPVELTPRKFRELHHEAPSHRKHMADVVLAPQQIEIPVGLEERKHVVPVLQVVLVAVDEVGIGMDAYFVCVPVQSVRLDRIVVVEEDEEVTRGNTNSLVGVLSDATVALEQYVTDTLIPRDKPLDGAGELSVLRACVHENQL